MTQFIKVIGYITEDLDNIQPVEQYINLNEVVRFITKEIKGETQCIIYCKNCYIKNRSDHLATYVVHEDSYPLIVRIMDEASYQNEDMVSPL